MMTTVLAVLLAVAIVGRFVDRADEHRRFMRTIHRERKLRHRLQARYRVQLATTETVRRQYVAEIKRADDLAEALERVRRRDTVRAVLN